MLSLIGSVLFFLIIVVTGIAVHVCYKKSTIEYNAKPLHYWALIWILWGAISDLALFLAFFPGIK